MAQHTQAPIAIVLGTAVHLLDILNIVPELPIVAVVLAAAVVTAGAKLNDNVSNERRKSLMKGMRYATPCPLV